MIIQVHATKCVLRQRTDTALSDKPVQEQRSEDLQIQKSNKVRDSGEARRRIRIVRCSSLESSSDLEVVSKDDEQRENNVDLRDTTRPIPSRSI